MKISKTLLLDTFRNIVKKKISFLSIMAIMIVGIGGLFTIFNVEQLMRKSGDDFFHKHNFMDFEIVASMGVSEDDISQIRMIDEIEDAEGVYSLKGVLKSEKEADTVNILSQTKTINKSTLMEGKFPEKPDEVALNKVTMQKWGVQVGDTVNLTQDTANGLFKTDTFRVVGEIIHPEYATVKGYLALLNEKAFDKSAFNDRYIGVYIKAKTDPKEEYFSPAYSKHLEEIQPELESLVDTFTKVRTKDTKDEAADKIDDAKKEAKEGLDDARTQLEDGREELNKGLEEGRAKLEEAEEKYAEGSETLAKELAKAEKELKDGQETLNKELALAKSKIEEGEAEAKRELDKGYNLLCSLENEYNNGKSQYEAGKKEYDDGVNQLNEYRDQIEEGEAKIREKLDEEAGKIEDYITILTDLFDETSKALEEIEQQFPELSGDVAWEEFKSLVADKDSIIATLRDESVSVEDKKALLEDLVKRIDTIYQNLPSAEQVLEKLKEVFETVKQKVPEKFEELKQLIDAIKQLSEARKQLEEEEAKLPEAEAKLKEAADKLQDARSKLDAGWGEYHSKKAEAEKQIADARAQYEKAKADGEKKISDGWKEYKKVKKEKEEELADARKTLDESWEEYESTKLEKEAELSKAWSEYGNAQVDVNKKLKEAQNAVDNLDDYNYIVYPRNMNVTFLQLDSSVKAIRVFVIFFVPLFFLVASLVVFSTIAIIVDEQKRQIGGVKALGLYNKEISVKFVVFALTGTVIGYALGIGFGCGLTAVIREPMMEGLYIDQKSTALSVFPMVLLAIGTLAMSTIVAIMACRKLLKCSAIGLINGSEPQPKIMKGGSGLAKKDGNLYSNLIFNNMRMDISRVIVTAIVILGCSTLIGFGITLKHAYSASVYEQVNNVNNYTIQVVWDDDTKHYEKELKEKVQKTGGVYVEACFTEGMIELEGVNEGLYLIAGENEDLKKVILITDLKKQEIDLPKDGILLPKKSYSRLHGADEVKILDRKLYTYNAPVSAPYFGYIGCVALCDSANYEALYGKEYEPNSLYMKWDDVSTGEAEEYIREISDKIRILKPDYVTDAGDSVDVLLDIVAGICVFLSILLSLMILINYTNILVSRRMKEMLVMRINGFSLKEVIGYVAKESAAITAFGIILGTVFGILFSYFAVSAMENTYTSFVRTPYPPAWIFAIIFNIVFAIIIDLIAFRKIGKVPLTDVNKY